MMTLKQFQHDMWLDNCDERSAWTQAVIPEVQYIEENEAFLLDLYMSKVITDKLEGLQRGE